MAARRPLRVARGYTLLEVLAVLGVLAVLLVFLAPVLVALAQDEKVIETEQANERIYRAIFGIPARGEFGYLGDMGRLPSVLTELVDRGTQAAFHTADAGTEHAGGVGTGWRGPYLAGAVSNTDLLRDAWGQSLSYTNSGATAGQLTSTGPNGAAGDADDITFPVHAPATTGRLYVSVLANDIPGALGATAKVYSAVNGEQAGSATQKRLPPPAGQSDTFNGFAFELTHGLHVLVAAHTGVGPGGCVTVQRAVPVKVHAGQAQVREVRMLTNATVLGHGALPCAIPD